jgi:hypothetical protein
MVTPLPVVVTEFTTGEAAKACCPVAKKPATIRPAIPTRSNQAITPPLRTIPGGARKPAAKEQSPVADVMPKPKLAPVATPGAYATIFLLPRTSCFARATRMNSIFLRMKCGLS